MLQAVLNKAKRWGLYDGKHPLELATICETADTELFFNVNLRTRPHQHVLPIKNVYACKNSLDRMPYVDMY